MPSVGIPPERRRAIICGIRFPHTLLTTLRTDIVASKLVVVIAFAIQLSNVVAIATIPLRAVINITAKVNAIVLTLPEPFTRADFFAAGNALTARLRNANETHNTHPKKKRKQTNYMNTTIIGKTFKAKSPYFAKKTKKTDWLTIRGIQNPDKIGEDRANAKRKCPAARPREGGKPPPLFWLGLVRNCQCNNGEKNDYANFGPPSNCGSRSLFLFPCHLVWK